MAERLNLAVAILNDPARAARVALREPQRSWTYAELADTVARFGAALGALGVTRGDRVAVLSPDGLEAAAAILAAVHMGAVAVPLSELWRANDVRAFLRDAGAVVTVVHATLEPVLDEVRAEVPSLRKVVVIGTPRGDDHAFDALVVEHPPGPAADTQASDLALLLYSTCPSERPRGSAHTHATPLAAFAAYTRGILPIDENDRVFSPARLATAFGLGAALIYPLAAGAESILLPQQARSRHVFDVLAGMKPTLLMASPSLVAQLLADVGAESSGHALGSSLRACVAAGETLPAPLIARVRRELGAEVLPAYGLTEAFHFVIATPPGKTRPGSAGVAIPGYQVRVMVDGKQAAPHEIGTLEVRGPTLATSYWNRLDDSQVTFADGWLHTSDRFMVDEDGFFYHCGRNDDLFKVGGKWVSPSEVERTLLAHEAVWECAVIGVDDEDGLLKPLAFVVPNVGHNPGPELERELILHVKREIAPYKYPRWVQFTDEIPRGPNGKILRYKLLRKRPSRKIMLPL
jgi:benzoate-CoA ligase family protein